MKRRSNCHILLFVLFIIFFIQTEKNKILQCIIQISIDIMFYFAEQFKHYRSTCKRHAYVFEISTSYIIRFCRINNYQVYFHKLQIPVFKAYLLPSRSNSKWSLNPLLVTLLPANLVSIVTIMNVGESADVKKLSPTMSPQRLLK